MLTKIKNQKSKINFGKLEIKMSITCIAKKNKRYQSYISKIKMSITSIKCQNVNLIQSKIKN